MAESTEKVLVMFHHVMQQEEIECAYNKII